MSRSAADLGRPYVPLTSRNGLVVLRGWSDICVYDPMTGNRAYMYLPDPPNIGYGVYDHMYVLLTAADGIGCSFLLLATDPSVSQIQTVSSSSSDAAAGTWGPVIYVDRRHGVRSWDVVNSVQPHSCAVVLNGLIHWLMCLGSWDDVDFHVLTYDVPRHGTRAATTAGSIEFPKACRPHRCERSDLHLTSSPEGRLSLLVADRLTISVWLLLSAGSGSGSTSRWERQTVIDTEAVVRSVSSEWPSNKVEFVSSSAGVWSGAAVLLRPYMGWDFVNDKGEKWLVLDVGTGEMRRVNKKEGLPYEVDMEARLAISHENLRLV